jgi:hypothetical protein
VPFELEAVAEGVDHTLADGLQPLVGKLVLGRDAVDDRERGQVVVIKRIVGPGLPEAGRPRAGMGVPLGDERGNEGLRSGVAKSACLQVVYRWDRIEQVETLVARVQLGRGCRTAKMADSGAPRHTLLPYLDESARISAARPRNGSYTRPLTGQPSFPRERGGKPPENLVTPNGAKGFRSFL